MTEIDADKLRALHEAANSKTMHPEDVAAARFQLGNFVKGPNFPAIIAMAEENARMREALDRIKRIAAGYEPDGSDYDEGYFEGQRNMANIARRALGRDKA
jgi:hypothetical protein